MGIDAGFLRGAPDPVLPFRPGDAGWLPAWRQADGPAAWMGHSVVWYAQRITQAPGAARLRRDVRAAPARPGPAARDAFLGEFFAGRDRF
jgi:beta-lactamase class D